MRRFLVRRLLQMVAVVLLVTTATFVLVHLAPGDPLSAALDDPRITEAVRAKWRATYGFDRPIAEQYVRYLGAVARGDLGFSFSMNQPVSSVLRQTLPNTLMLMGAALVLSFAAGIVLGVVQAVKSGTRLDRIVSSVSLTVYSIPDFWLALVALLFFTYRVRVFPPGGAMDATMYPYMTAWERIVDRMWHLVLPVGTLAALTSAAIARHQRGAMLDVLHEDFVRTARAKGAVERRVMFRHALRNALLPVITLLGLSLPALLGGAVLVERVFSWPGMGQLAVNAVAMRDYPLVLASVIIGSVLVATGGLLTDVLSAAADPRTRD